MPTKPSGFLQGCSARCPDCSVAHGTCRPIVNDRAARIVRWMTDLHGRAWGRLPPACERFRSDLALLRTSACSRRSRRLVTGGNSRCEPSRRSGPRRSSPRSTAVDTTRIFDAVHAGRGSRGRVMTARVIASAVARSHTRRCAREHAGARGIEAGGGSQRRSLQRFLRIR